MKYKALFLDVDGTTVPNRQTGMPSPAVTRAIAKASRVVHVCLATGRPLFLAKPIIDHLQLSGPCVITDGTQIYDPQTKKYIYEAPLSAVSVSQSLEILKKYTVQVYLNDGSPKEFVYTGGKLPKRVFVLFVAGLDKKEADAIIKDLEQVENIIPYKGVAWEKGKEYIAVCSPGGTKLKGIVEVAKLYGIETHEMIGVGDGYNDFPLLMACGLKIAMGNAVPELKAIADFVAPSVEEDGVVTVIEKFILES